MSESTGGFRVLGPVQAEFGGKQVRLSRRRERGLLALLALEAGQPVSVPRLIELLLGNQPPDNARAAIHTYISRLRACLNEAGAADHGVVLVRGPGDSYALTLPRDWVDAHRFTDLTATAKAKAEPAQQANLLRQALELWRGPVLADAGDWLRDVVGARWELLRRSALQARIAADLAIGVTNDLVGELIELAAADPLCEPLAALLMRAMHQSGQRAEALAVFRRTRDRIADEFGLEPGDDLQELHRHMLKGTEPATNDPPATGPEPFTSTTRKPRQLPTPPAAFVGRGDELAILDEALAAGGQAGRVVISAVDGGAGVGKTALALHWAHRNAGRFPDGQLYIDLRGYSPDAPVMPIQALARFIRALGVPGETIPVDVDETAALYRTLLTDKQVLVLLDNAASPAQVAPLLPGTAGCLVVVTSRRRLASLDAARTVSLDTLPRADAVTLFARTAGADRDVRPPARVAEVVELCGRLPLAIRIAAARLRSHPSWSVADLAARLRDHDQRLAELADEDGSRGVAAALDVSYQQLTADQQRLYRLLGLHPGPDIDRYATAALAGTTLPAASRLLDQLLDTNLLQEPAVGRYAFHDLIRAHAAGNAVTEAEPDRRAALTRLLDHYRHTAAIAMDTTYPHDRERRPRFPPAATPTPDLPDRAGASAWLDTELPNLLAAGRYATDQGWPDHTWHLSGVLHRHLRTRGRYTDAETLHQRALTAARATANRPAETDALTRLGVVHQLQGRYPQATELLTQALQIAQTTGNRIGQLDTLHGLAWVHQLQGRYPQAIDHFTQALQIAQTTGNRIGQLDALTGLGDAHLIQGRYETALDHFTRAQRLAHDTGHHEGQLAALRGLGWIHQLQGRYPQAIDHFTQALQIAQTTGNRIGQLISLTGLGHANRRHGRHELAIVHFGQALQIARSAGHRPGELDALRGLGDAHRRLGQHQQAEDHYQQTLALAEQVSDRNGQYEARQGLGRLQHATGHPEQALAHHRQALTLATDLQQPADQARAQDGLAHAYHALHQHNQARHHWQLALDLLTSLGTDHTEDEETSATTIRSHLARLDRHLGPGA